MSKQLPTAPTMSRRVITLNPALLEPIPPPAHHKAWRMQFPLGLGDWVETWAKPIARQIDHLTKALTHWARRRLLTPAKVRIAILKAALTHPGRPTLFPILTAACGLLAIPLARLLLKSGLRSTRIDGCTACSRRRRLFNAWVPDVRSWRAWLTLYKPLARLLAASCIRPANPGPRPPRLPG